MKREYTHGEKGALALGVIGAGFVRMGLDAALLYYTYATGHGIAFGFGVLCVEMVVWNKLVVQPLYNRVKEVFGPELRRGDEPNTTWKDLAFAVAAAIAKGKKQ